MTGVNNKYNIHTEIASLLADGLVCLCNSLRGISIKLKLSHNQFKVPL